MDVACKLKGRIKSDLKITASVGIAPNKYLAKLASDMKKPDGLVLISPDDIDRVLPPLPVTKLWGIGTATAARLAPLGVRTIADLRKKPLDWLEKHLGSEAERYFYLAHGIDDRPVVPDREAKSIGHEQTFEINIVDVDEVRRVLLDQVEQVASRLRKNRVHAGGITLKIRFGQFKTISRSMTLGVSTAATNELWQAARRLFDNWSFQPVRLIGVTAERLTRLEGESGLFADPQRERQKKLDKVADQINEKFGKRAIRRGGAS